MYRGIRCIPKSENWSKTLKTSLRKMKDMILKYLKEIRSTNLQSVNCSNSFWLDLKKKMLLCILHYYFFNLSWWLHQKYTALWKTLTTGSSTTGNQIYFGEPLIFQDVKIYICTCELYQIIEICFLLSTAQVNKRKKIWQELKENNQ